MEDNIPDDSDHIDANMNLNIVDNDDTIDAVDDDDSITSQ